MVSSFKAQPQRPLTGGIVQNAPSELLGPGQFLQAHNFQFRLGQAQKVATWTPTGKMVTGRPSLIGVTPFPVGGEQSVIGSSDGLWTIDDALNLTSLLPLGANATKGEPWHADYMMGKWYFTTIATGVYGWAGSGTPGVLTTPHNGADIAQFNLHILLANLGVGSSDAPLSVEGSNLGDATDWTHDLTTTPAGEHTLLEVPEGGDAIQRILRLANYLAIYKTKSIHLLSYGGPDIYSRQVISEQNGLVAPQALAWTQAGHFYLGSDDLYMFNSAPPTPFASRVWKWWTAQVDVSNMSNVFAFHNVLWKEIWFVYQPTGASGYDFSGARALVYNYEYDVFSTRDMPFTAIGFVRSPSTTNAPVQTPPSFESLPGPMGSLILTPTQAIIPNVSELEYRIIGADSIGNLSVLDNAFGAGDATLETGDTLYGDPANLSMLNGLDLEAPVLTGTLQVWVCARMSLADPVAYAGPYTISTATTTHRRVDFMATGRWFRFKFVSPAGSDVTLRGFAPRSRQRGLY